MEYSVKEILNQFNINVDAAPYGEGHINTTYIAELAPDKYILQKINTNIFTDPDGLMKNIAAVTEFLRKTIIANGGDPKRETLNLIMTKDGAPYYRTKDGSCFRLYTYVENTVTYQNVEKKEQFYNAAKAFGKFQRQLAEFPAETLTETIKDFHNTRVRFEAFKQAVAEDKKGRKADVMKEIEFVLARENDCGVIVDAMSSGEIPVRVTHNDTKLNNVLFDADTDEAICVIDLDTVMPGSMLYDYGDSIRFGASSGAEDEIDLNKIYCDMELFRAYTKGYIEAMGSSITKNEIELLPFSAKLMTYECGMRFLADYLNGDTYFKIHRPNHNLDRARTQFKLVADMENKMDEMKKIVKECM